MWTPVLALLGACQKHPAPQPLATPSTAETPHVPSAPTASTSPPAPSASAAAPSASAAPAPVTTDAPCKALGKKGSTELSPIQEGELQLSAAPDALYALGYTHELARVKLYRFSRAGGPLEVVAEQKGIGDRKRFAVAGGAAFYAQAGKLVRLGPKSGEASVLYDGIQSPVAVVGDRVLGIACDNKAKADRLLELPIAGGEPQLVAELPHSSHERCQYSSLLADEHDVFIADWNAHAVIRVSRSDHAVTNVVTHAGFPGPLLLDGDALAYNSTAGLTRVARDGTSPLKLASSDISLAPYSLTAQNSTAYWVFDAIAYAVTTTLRKVPRGGGAAQTIMVLKNADPDAANYEGQGLVDFAVDEQCVYVAQTQFKRPGIQLVVKAL
jgi:hypothetical protein